LDDENVCFTNVFIDLDQHVLIRKAHNRRAAEIGPQILANVLREFWMSGAADHLDGTNHITLLCD